MSLPNKIIPMSVGGTIDSFNHEGKGKQSFDDAKIRCGAIIHSRSSVPSAGGGTLRSFSTKGDGDQSFVRATIQSGGNIFTL